MTARVLLVEDDADLRVTTRLVLVRHGFEVEVAGDGVEALDRLRSHPVDAAVVDVMMPRLDGISLVKRIREFSALPVVFVTARDLPHDQLAGFEAGADDYVVKPFDGDVLAARLHAVLRRAGSPDTTPVISRGEFVVDLDGMTATRAGVPISLSATEFRLLAAFAANTGIVLSLIRLLELAWAESEWIDERVVDVNIQRLRAKIGAEHIETVRGAGYKMPKT